MNNQPGVEKEEKHVASAKTGSLFELVAIIVIGFALFFIFDVFLHWLARTYDVQMLEIGRRAKFADILAAVAALVLTNFAAKLLGIKPSQSKVK